MDNEEDEGAHFYIRLLIRHPSIDPGLITANLGLTSDLSWLAGTPRMTPTGTLLPGLHEYSTWQYGYTAYGNRLFSNEIEKMIARLAPHARFLAELVEGMGSITLIVDVPGHANIAGEISWRQMARLSELRTDFGIEVFPDSP
jgi:hypothetical protein